MSTDLHSMIAMAPSVTSKTAAEKERMYVRLSAQMGNLATVLSEEGLTSAAAETYRMRDDFEHLSVYYAQQAAREQQPAGLAAFTARLEAGGDLHV